MGIIKVLLGLLYVGFISILAILFIMLISSSRLYFYEKRKSKRGRYYQ